MKDEQLEKVLIALEDIAEAIRGIKQDEKRNSY